jgi:hypothetical protein
VVYLLCGLRESDANVRVYNDARSGDGASDLRARGAWCPGDDRRAAESELIEWTEPRSDAADAVDAADDADAERGSRLECGVPCGSAWTRRLAMRLALVSQALRPTSTSGCADVDQARTRATTPASGLQSGCNRNHPIHISG